MIDPAERWRRHHGFDAKAAWAGLLSFADLPYTEDPAELAGVDVAVVGAPMDDLVSDVPGTRFGPRAIRAATPTATRITSRPDRLAGDATRRRLRRRAGRPGRPRSRPTGRSRQIVAEVLGARALPIVLGGDHSITEPNVRACARTSAVPVGLVHFDTDTDGGAVRPEPSRTGRRCTGSSSRATSTRPATSRSAYAAGGPSKRELDWQAEHGITSFFMRDVSELGIGEVVERTLEVVGAGPRFLTVDVDVLDPCLCARYWHARAGRHDPDRPVVGLPHDRRPR